MTTSPLPTQTEPGSPDLMGEALMLPPATLSLVRRAIREEVGDLSATRILQNAGFAFGELLFREFVRELGVKGGSEDAEIRSMDEARFWAALSRFLGQRGWGRLESERVHPGLAVVYAYDWAETAPLADEDQPGCHFTSGFLSHLMSQLAGQPIAVLEVECASAGAHRCSFLFGSEAAVHEVYGLLLDDTPLDEALARL